MRRKCWVSGFKAAARAGAFCALVAALALAQGCARRFPSEKIPKTVWLILPFEQPPAQAANPRVITGWWFGADTVRQNPRAGDMMADTLARAMAPLDFIVLYSSIDLRYYFADKRDLLKDAYPHLTDEQVKAAMAEVPRVDFGRELGADKILTGRIVKHRMIENRTIHWWSSELEVECQVIDVISGEVEWRKQYAYDESFESQSSLQEKLAKDFIHDIKKDYFLKLARKAG
jgi:hypothetical protein